ncbi:MAG TPA: haloacid dehalogenase type II [Burkholderiales bacterium]|jgi:2-haloacid dehalogenase
MQQIQALVFDAYGTLYDVYSVAARAEDFFPGHGAALSQLWRQKQLEYSWLRSLMGTYADFNQVTAEALRYAVTALKLKPDEGAIAALIAQYVHLAPHPEVPAALAALKPGRKLAILSNGAPDTLDALVRNSGLAAQFDAVLSVDSVGIYKPDMRIYALAEKTLGVDKRHIGFVSSNCWDAVGAATYGFTVFWANRSGAPVDVHGRAPDHIVTGLDQIAALLNAA